jgi:uncharacterized protein YutE (UPF0331/DUF86 family)
MTPRHISWRVIADRFDLIDSLLEKTERLPLASLEDFVADDRNVSAAESNVRRALEALMDVGRHILAKGFASGVTEYKEIVARLHKQGVLAKSEADLMHKMAGYRNRLVHLYHEVTAEELYQICVLHLNDIRHVRSSLQRWLESNSSVTSFDL